MGFELEHQKIVFGPEHGRYAGLEVTMNEMSIGTLEVIENLSEDSADKRRESVRVMVRLLGVGDPDEGVPPGIREWNFTTGGEPVPISAATVNGLGAAVVLHLIDQWASQAQVPTPLSQPPNGGGRSVEVSIPMDIPSLSPERLRELGSTGGSSNATPLTLSAHFAENPLL